MFLIFLAIVLMCTILWKMVRRVRHDDEKAGSNQLHPDRDGAMQLLKKHRQEWERTLYNKVPNPKIRQLAFKILFEQFLGSVRRLYNDEAVDFLHQQKCSRDRMAAGYLQIEPLIRAALKRANVDAKIGQSGSTCTNTNVGGSDVDVEIVPESHGFQETVQLFAAQMDKIPGFTHTGIREMDRLHHLNRHTIFEGKFTTHLGLVIDVDLKVRKQCYIANFEGREEMYHALRDESISAPITYLKHLLKGTEGYSDMKWWYHEYAQTHYSSPEIGYIFGPR